MVRRSAVLLASVTALSAAAAETLPYQRFHGGCKGIEFEAVEQAISDARTCAIAAEIHRICSSSDAFGLKRLFEQALEQRCTADFEGKLTAAGQKMYDKALTKCGQGLETPDGRTTQLAVTVEAKCRAEAAVARSREYWQTAPLD